jgi:hypothetical protein
VSPICTCGDVVCGQGEVPDFQKSCFQFMFEQFRVVDTVLLYFLFLNLGRPIILYDFLND